MSSKILSVLVALGLLFLFTDDGFAAKKKKKKKGAKPKSSVGQLISPNDVFTVRVDLKTGKKKSKGQDIFCLDITPGLTQQTTKGLLFKSFNKLIKAEKKKKNSRSSAKLIKYTKLMRAAKGKCLKPDFLSLERHRGSFGEKEAHILYNRFAFGGSPAQIQAAVRAGLDGTVRSLTSPVPEDDVLAVERDFRCVGHRYVNSQGQPVTDNQCNLANRNDLYGDGIRYGLLRTLLFSPNPFFYKLFMFLHDERATASVSAADSSYNYTRIDYIEMLRRAAFSGDYRQLLRELISSPLVNFLYLDGGNNLGSRPNENWAREWWELFSIGPTSIDGLISGRISPETANYNDFDIAQAALAFSGPTEYCEYLTFPDGPDQNSEPDQWWDCAVGFFPFPPGHAVGPKTIFGGSRYQSTVYNYNDMLAATLADERLAESLALDIWNEFICKENITPRAVRELAKVIRDNNYNLTQVMRVVMSSKAVYAERNRNCLIKHPVELLVGFLRQTGVPLRGNTPYKSMSTYLSDMDQNVLLPPSVFGWNEKRLAGEAYILEWRNSLISLVNADEQVQVNGQWRDAGRFFRETYLPGVSDERGLVNKVSSILGITLNASQVDSLSHYLRHNYFYRSSGAHSSCSNGLNECFNEVGFDPSPGIQANETKVRGVFAAQAMLPEYRMK